MNRVLIIEDDAVTRRQLAQLFRFEDFEVSEADSGQAGIAAAASFRPDLIICDIMMPGMDGFGVLQTLRKRAETALTPFIFLTAKAGGNDVRQGMNRGADDYITKPFDPEALLSAARQRLDRRRLQLAEAERHAADTSMLAAAVLPREMEGCLAQIEAISDLLAAKSEDTCQVEMGCVMKQELARLRVLSERLKLYSELPSLYARRFSDDGVALKQCSSQIAVDTARRTAGQWERAADLQTCAGADRVPLPANALEILVRELVDNACKFSPPSTRIDLDIRPEQAYWKLTVADQGRGMRPEQVREIGAFKQFWSGPERPCGLGLGLVLVQTLTRLNSGEVLIQSEPNAGTRVTVMVPSE